MLSGIWYYSVKAPGKFHLCFNLKMVVCLRNFYRVLFICICLKVPLQLLSEIRRKHLKAAMVTFANPLVISQHPTNPCVDVVRPEYNT